MEVKDTQKEEQEKDVLELVAYTLVLRSEPPRI